MTTPNCATRNITLLLCSVIGSMIPAVSAFADTYGPEEQSSNCTPAISSRSGGGRGAANLIYDAYRKSERTYVINWADSWADNFWTCSGDTQVSPYQTKVKLELRFDGTNLSCTDGYSINLGESPGVSISHSCTTTGTTLVVTVESKCSTYSSSCQVELGYTELTVSYGGRLFNYVNAKTIVEVTGASGATYSWETEQI